MIDTKLAAELQASLCTAIASLIEDEEIVSTRPAEAYSPLAQRLQRLGADISTLAAAMEVIARSANE